MLHFYRKNFFSIVTKVELSTKYADMIHRDMPCQVKGRIKSNGGVSTYLRENDRKKNNRKIYIFSVDAEYIRERILVGGGFIVSRRDT